MEHPFHEFPKHLYPGPETPKLKKLLLDIETGTLQKVGFPGPIVVHDAGAEALARKAGYVDEYIPAEYPKHIVVERDKDGNPVKTVTVNDAKEEMAVK